LPRRQRKLLAGSKHSSTLQTNTSRQSYCSDDNGESHSNRGSSLNLYHGLSPKQFVEELDRQVNLKQVLTNANDPMFGKKPLKLATSHNGSSAARLSIRGSSRGRANAAGSSSMNKESELQSQLSLHSNLSTATDRLKRILKGSPVRIKGAGFQETPYSKMIIEEQTNKPKRKMDFILRVDRTQKIIDSSNSKRDREERLFESLERSLQPLVEEQSRHKAKQNRTADLSGKLKKLGMNKIPEIDVTNVEY
jgi:hypothetical protein